MRCSSVLPVITSQPRVQSVHPIRCTETLNPRTLPAGVVPAAVLGTPKSPPAGVLLAADSAPPAFAPKSEPAAVGAPNAGVEAAAALLAAPPVNDKDRAGALCAGAVVVGAAGAEALLAVVVAGVMPAKRPPPEETGPAGESSETQRVRDSTLSAQLLFLCARAFPPSKLKAVRVCRVSPDPKGCCAV